MAAGISPSRKSDVPISLPHERSQRCSVSPRPVSWQGKRQRSGPKANVFGGVVKGITQVSGAAFFHTGIGSSE